MLKKILCVVKTTGYEHYQLKKDVFEQFDESRKELLEKFLFDCLAPSPYVIQNLVVRTQKEKIMQHSCMRPQKKTVTLTASTRVTGGQDITLSDGRRCTS